MELESSGDTSVGSERRLVTGLAVLFAGVAVLAGADIAADLGGGGTDRHVLLEAMVGLLGLGGLAWTGARVRRLGAAARSLGDRAAELARRLDASERDAARWRQEAADLITGLGEAIDRQLDRWSLSPAEKEVALLLLKGLSHKEIAQARSVSEATVRQQAAAVYQKAGLGGRHDLAAFFLEDLLDPHPRGR